MTVSNASFFSSVAKLLIMVANQTYTDISGVPDGRLLQVFSSRLSGGDIFAEYEHTTIDAELSLTYL